MNTEVLSAFTKLAELESYTKVAQLYKVSQSTITKRIASLEEELGEELLLHNTKEIKLTHKGRIFLEYANEILRIQQDAKQHLKQEMLEERIRIGCNESFYLDYLQEILIGLMKNHSNLRIDMTHNHSPILLTMLYDDLIDFYFGVYPFHDPYYNCSILMEDEVVFVTSPDNPAYEDGITKEKIKELPLIRDALSCVADARWFEEIYAENKNILMNVPIGNRNTEYLLAGMGYGFVMHRYAQQYLKDGRLVRIQIMDHEPLQVRTYMITKKSRQEQLHQFTEQINYEFKKKQ